MLLLQPSVCIMYTLRVAAYALKQLNPIFAIRINANANKFAMLLKQWVKKKQRVYDSSRWITILTIVIRFRLVTFTMHNTQDHCNGS